MIAKGVVFLLGFVAGCTVLFTHPEWMAGLLTACAIVLGLSVPVWFVMWVLRFTNETK